MKALLLLALGTISVLSSPVTPRQPDVVSYDGFKLVQVPPLGPLDVQVNWTNLVQDLNLQVLSEHGMNPYLPTDILVPASKSAECAERLGFTNYTVVHNDMGALIKREAAGVAPSWLSKKLFYSLRWFKCYHSPSDHDQFLHNLHFKHPHLTEIIKLGKSHEGRPITALRIHKRYLYKKDHHKPAIVIYGTMHAREWISAPTVEFIAYSLLRWYKSKVAIRKLLYKYDVYIIPVANPDGLEFSRTTDRKWRKNRRPPPAGSNCYGVDINRNFDIVWSDPVGASTDPCEFEVYKGPSVESEPETVALASFSRKLQAGKGIKLFIDVHSYGQMMLYPWGYKDSDNPDGQMYKDALKPFQDAVKANRGTTYTVKQAKDLAKTTGASDDYHYGTLNVAHSYTLELPYTSSFVVPSEDILPIARETWDGLWAFFKSNVFA